MVIHPSGLIGALHERLPELLPAHQVHGAMAAEFADEPEFDGRRRGDYVYVQGRGDRLHAFLCFDDRLSDEVLQRFAGCDANWRWLVAWSEDASASLQDDARRAGLGVIAAPRVGPLVKLLDATPNPGIFIKGYPALRRHWRTLASW